MNFQPAHWKNKEIAVYKPTRPDCPPIPYVERPQSELVNEESSSKLLEYWHLLRRRKGTVLLTAFLGALAGLLFTLPQTPIYQARTSLEIQGLNENFLNMKQVDPIADSYSGEPYIQTQLKILQSESLIERIVEKLKLEKRAEFVYATDRISAWRKALGLSPRKPISRANAIAMASSNLKVRTSGGARIVEILCESPDPQLAADFANTLASEFIQRNVEIRWQSTQRTGEWLTRQLQDLQIKLEKSEDALQTYATTAGLMFTSEKENVAEEKLRQLQEELSKAQAERVSKQSSYELVASASPESLPEVLDDPSLRDYQTKLTDLGRQLAELSALYVPAHYKVKQVESQISQLESALEKTRGNIVKRIHNEYRAAQLREKMLATAFATQAKVVSGQSSNTIHYNILKREVDTNRSLYEAMLQKVKEAGIVSAMRASNINVIDGAKPPSVPYKPSVSSNSSKGLLAGLFLGVAFVFIRERADRSIQEPGEASLYLKVPELGVIPSAKADFNKRLARGPKLLPTLRRVGKANDPDAEGDRKSEHGDRTNEEIQLVTWQSNPSLLAESFRATLTSILFSSQQGTRPHIICLTSPCPREGKSTAVINLGIALAEIRYRVLLIDGDMRKPRLHSIFNVPNNWGLSDLLQWNRPFDQWPIEYLCKETRISGLYVLPSGSAAFSTLSLLHSARMPDLLNRFRQEFDIVLIDTPPMLQMPDARVLGRLSGSVILIIRAGQTSRDTAIAASERFVEDGTPVLGTILNDWDPTTARHKYGYYDSYYQYYRQPKPKNRQNLAKQASFSNFNL